MRQHSKKIILAFFVLLISLIILLQFPHLFIKKQFDYQSLSIYSNAPIPLDKTVKTTLDSVLTNLKTSAFHQDKNHFYLYFVHQTMYEKLIRLFGRKNMAFARGEQLIFSAIPDFETSVLHRNNNEYEILNLVQILTHESIHSQMYATHASYGNLQTPSWINEGYAEYISYQPIRGKSAYQLVNIVDKLETQEGDWLKTVYGFWTPRSYVRDRILIEYLIDVKGKTIEEIIEDKALLPNIVYKEVIEWRTRNDEFKSK